MTWRLLASEELDPNGPRPYRWITPDVEHLGWSTVALPTLSAVHLMGTDAYRAFLIRCVDELRPHVVLVNPPRDFLDLSSCDQIREVGALLIAWIDDLPPLDDQTQAAEIQEDLARRFDRCVSPLTNANVLGDGVVTVPWVVTTESVDVDDPNAPEHEAVIVAPYTPGRAALARVIADYGVAIACYGPGWSLGPVTRPSRLALYRRARGVIIVDGQGLELVEAARVGARLIVERVPSLSPYLSAAVGLASFSTASECARLFTSGSFPRWTNPPAWDAVWPMICEGLTFADQPERTSAPSLVQFYATLAHVYELSGNTLAAHATFEAWARLEPDAYGPSFGLAQSANKMRQFDKAASQAEQALARLPPPVASARGRIDTESGLGLSGALDPRVEMWAVRLWALQHSQNRHIALKEAAELDPMTARAVRAAIPLDFSNVDDRALGQVLVGA